MIIEVLTALVHAQNDPRMTSTKDGEREDIVRFVMVVTVPPFSLCSNNERS